MGQSGSPVIATEDPYEALFADLRDDIDRLAIVLRR